MVCRGELNKGVGLYVEEQNKGVIWYAGEQNEGVGQYAGEQNEGIGLGVYSVEAVQCIVQRMQAPELQGSLTSSQFKTRRYTTYIYSWRTGVCSPQTNLVLT